MKKLLFLVFLSVSTGLFSQNAHVKMKEFIFLVRLPDHYGPTEAAAARPQWTALTDKWKADSIFVTSFIFPDEGFEVTNSSTSKKEYVKTANGLKIVSSIILRLSSMEEALKLAKLCPIFNQGGSIEVREVNPRPVTPK